MSMKCVVRSCNAPHSSICDFRPSHTDDDGRLMKGDRCGLKLCADHSFPVAGRRLCAWHRLKAAEMGVT